MASAGAGRNRAAERTRPDQPLPRRPAEAPPEPSPPRDDTPVAGASSGPESAGAEDGAQDGGPANDAASASAGEPPEEAAPPADTDSEPTRAEGLPLPRPVDPSESTAPVPAPSPAPSPPPPPPAQVPPAQAPAAPPTPTPAPPAASAPASASRTNGSTWHRLHYPVGAFLIAYGITVLVAAALDWGARRHELEGYFGSGSAGAALVVVKAFELVLALTAAAAVARRRDMWLVAPLAGWMAGFAMFAVLDVLKGRWGGLVEHLLYLAAFIVLLFLSYGLSARVQVVEAAAARRAGTDPAPGTDQGGRPGGGLTRTQEFALSAIDRVNRARRNPQQPPPS
ncbi:MULTISPECIES: hypothetical protein [Actinomadura]|uniref:Uncharacterized protein n=2 Tax=Actinomadura yumaensis TaxID=111807 RepID=A0ABW2CUB3_9ACTN|nr:hypothetical protein [Actinomadura sp. J1-007]MWK33232.1 hypothetical protein [Actinomadura sp. J1-007]